jgi:hypothetical protein
MKSSDSSHSRAAQIIDLMTALLDENRLSQEIDEPIDAAVSKFPPEEESEFSSDRFHQAISKFVQAIYENALRYSRRLSASDAHDEAISLLESGYHGTFADGYDGAIRDASDPTHPGISLVLLRMAETIKARQRQAYRQWVISRYMNPADWCTQCAIADILINRYANWLPAEVRDGPPDRYTDMVCELLVMNLATNRQLQQSPTLS